MNNITNKEFASHTLSTAGGQKIRDVREAFDTLLNRLIEIEAPTSREMAITKTKLEEACFFAVKAVAINPANQQS